MPLPLIAGAAAGTAGRLGLVTTARALLPRIAAGVGRTVLGEGAEAAAGAASRRFAGTALSNLAERRAAAMASGRLAGMGQAPSALTRVVKAVVPDSPLAWATELGMEAAGAGLTYAMLPEGSPRLQAAGEQFLYGAGGSFLGRGLGGTLAQSRVAGLRPRAAQAVTDQWSGMGGMVGGFATAPLPLQSLKGWEQQQIEQQQLELAQRDDQVRRQTLQGLQQVSPYAASPYSTSPYAASLYG